MRIRLDPEDDLLHQADDDPNFNESRYYSFFQRDAGFGGWVRMGNRPNERYAEMTVCLYLPDGRVGFMFERPVIEGHTAHGKTFKNQKMPGQDGSSKRSAQPPPPHLP